jgi:N-acetylmuramic acid 6-phosphate etherase
MMSNKRKRRNTPVKGFELLKDRSKLTTEKRNVRSRGIDRHSSLRIVDIINAEDRMVAVAGRRERRALAEAVDIVAERLGQGGRLFYVGAGTSGRLGVLDAAECPPTYGTPRTMVQGIIAGGRRALVRSIEGAEDRAADGAAAVRRRRIGKRDVVVGIAACGLTPFVRGAIAAARKAGAATVFVTCAPEAVEFIGASLVINPVVGPEVVTGSTRMKAGTATKLVLNTITTGAMIRLGKVHDNLMVDLRATNAKLRDRAVRIVMEVTGVTRSQARALLKKARGWAKVAILMHFRKVDFGGARKLLAACGQSLRKAIES